MSNIAIQLHGLINIIMALSLITLATFLSNKQETQSHPARLSTNLLITGSCSLLTVMARATYLPRFPHASIQLIGCIPVVIGLFSGAIMVRYKFYAREGISLTLILLGALLGIVVGYSLYILAL